MTMRISGPTTHLPNIEGIDGLADKDALTSSGGAPEVGGASFGDELAQAVAGTGAMLAQANTESDALAKGKGNLHEAAVTLEEADISTRFMVKARNKIVDAYQEIMRMPV